MRPPRDEHQADLDRRLRGFGSLSARRRRDAEAALRDEPDAAIPRLCQLVARGARAKRALGWLGTALAVAAAAVVYVAGVKLLASLLPARWVDSVAVRLYGQILAGAAGAGLAAAVGQWPFLKRASEALSRLDDARAVAALLTTTSGEYTDLNRSRDVSDALTRLLSTVRAGDAGRFEAGHRAVLARILEDAAKWRSLQPWHDELTVSVLQALGAMGGSGDVAPVRRLAESGRTDSVGEAAQRCLSDLEARIQAARSRGALVSPAASPADAATLARPASAPPSEQAPLVRPAESPSDLPLPLNATGSGDA